jgi:hypothetical protein
VKYLSVRIFDIHQVFFIATLNYADIDVTRKSHAQTEKASFLPAFVAYVLAAALLSLQCASVMKRDDIDG